MMLPSLDTCHPVTGVVTAHRGEEEAAARRFDENISVSAADVHVRAYDVFALFVSCRSKAELLEPGVNRWFSIRCEISATAAFAGAAMPYFFLPSATTAARRIPEQRIEQGFDQPIGVADIVGHF